MTNLVTSENDITMHATMVPGAPNGASVAAAGVRRSRTDSDTAVDAPAARRSAWVFNELFACIMHDISSCPACAQFAQHIEPATDSQVFQRARDDQAHFLAHDASRLGFADGWNTAAQATARAEDRLRATEDRLRAATLHIGELERENQRLSAAPPTRGPVLRGGYGRGSGGGGRGRGAFIGRGQGQYTPYPLQPLPSYAPTYVPQQYGTWDTTNGLDGHRTGPAPTGPTSQFPPPLGPIGSASQLPPPMGPTVLPQVTTAPAEPTHEDAATGIPEELTSNADVDRLLTVMSTPAPTFDGRRALRIGRGWVYQANHASRLKATSPEQQYLLQRWGPGLPGWARKTNANHPPGTPALPNTPRISDPLDVWVNHYNLYTNAPLPMGVSRDPEGRVNASLLQGHLASLKLLGTNPPRTHLRRAGQYAIAGLFTDPHIYRAQLQATGAAIAANLDIRPLPTLSTDLATQRDTVDLSLPMIARQCAYSGITPELAQLTFMPWARAFLDACPDPLVPTAPLAPELGTPGEAPPVAQETHDPAPSNTTSADLSTANVALPVLAPEDADAIMVDLAALFDEPYPIPYSGPPTDL